MSKSLYLYRCFLYSRDRMSISRDSLFYKILLHKAYVLCLKVLRNRMTFVFIESSLSKFIKGTSPKYMSIPIHKGCPSRDKKNAFYNNRITKFLRKTLDILMSLYPPKYFGTCLCKLRESHIFPSDEIIIHKCHIGCCFRRIYLGIKRRMNLISFGKKTISGYWPHSSAWSKVLFPTGKPCCLTLYINRTFPCLNSNIRKYTIEIYNRSIEYPCNNQFSILPELPFGSLKREILERVWFIKKSLLIRKNWHMFRIVIDFFLGKTLISIANDFLFQAIIVLFLK